MRSPPRETRETGEDSSRRLGSPPKQEKLPQRREIVQGMRSVSPGPRVPIVPIIEGGVGGSRMRSPPRGRMEMGGDSSRTLGTGRQEKLPHKREMGGDSSQEIRSACLTVPLVPMDRREMEGTQQVEAPRSLVRQPQDSRTRGSPPRYQKLLRGMGVISALRSPSHDSRSLGSPPNNQKLAQRRNLEVTQGHRSPSRDTRPPGSPPNNQKLAQRRNLELTQGHRSPSHDSRSHGSPPGNQNLAQRRDVQVTPNRRSPSHDSRPPGSPPNNQNLPQRNLELTSNLRSPSHDSIGLRTPSHDSRIPDSLSYPNVPQRRNIQVSPNRRSPSRDSRPPCSPPTPRDQQRRNLELTSNLRSPSRDSQNLRSPSHDSRIPGSLPYPNLPQRRNIQVTPNRRSPSRDSRPPGSPPNIQNLPQRNLELTSNLRSPSHDSIGLRSPSHDSRIPGSLPYPNLPQRRNIQVTPTCCSQHPQDSRPQDCSQHPNNQNLAARNLEYSPIRSRPLGYPPNNQKPANLRTMRSLSADFSRPPGSPPNNQQRRNLELTRGLRSPSCDTRPPDSPPDNENPPQRNLERARVLCSQHGQVSRVHSSPPRDEKPCARSPGKNLRTMRSLSADFSRDGKTVTSSPQPALYSRKSSPRGPQSSRSNLIPPSLSPRGPQARGQDLLRPSLSTQKRQVPETSSAPTQTERRSLFRSRSPLQHVQSRSRVLSYHITSDSDNSEISHGTVEAHHCRVNMNGDIFPYKALSDAKSCVMVDNIAYQAESLLRVAFVMFGRPIRSSDDLITDDDIIYNSNVPDIATSAGRPVLGSKVIEEAVRVVAKSRRIDSRKRILKPGMRATICSPGVAWALGTEMQIVEVGWCIRDDCISPAVRAVISGDCGKSFVLDADGLNLHYLQCI